MARNVAVKLRDANYRTVTRSRTLDEPTDLASEIYAAHTSCGGRRTSSAGADCACSGSRRANCCRPARSRRRSFRTSSASARGRSRATADALRERFGDGAARPARLVKKREPQE